MKTLGQQVLVLGGFYFIISFLSSLGSGNIFEIFDLIMFITFICLLIILCCKRRYNFLINFQNRFRKIFNYLLGLGIVQYFETIRHGLTEIESFHLEAALIDIFSSQTWSNRQLLNIMGGYVMSLAIKRTIPTN